MSKEEDDDIMSLKYINTFHLDGFHVHHPSDSMFYASNRTYRTVCSLLGVVSSRENSSIFIFRKKIIYATPMPFDRQDVYILLRRTSKSNYTMNELFTCRGDVRWETHERV